MKTYEVPVRFSGRIVYSVEAECEEEAMALAEELGSEADCGDLEDIDWYAKTPYSCEEDEIPD